MLEESFAKSYDIDPYTRLVYRVRELYWTLARLFRQIWGGGGAVVWEAPATVGFDLGFDIPEQVAANPRIYIDVTDLLISRKATGIQRVLREIARNASELGLATPVAIDNGRFVAAAQGSGALQVTDGDILLLLDAGWNRVDRYPAALDDFKKQGGKVVACIYDLFPVIYPTLYGRRVVADFQAWVTLLVTHCENAVAISRSTAKSFEAFTRVIQTTPRPGFGLGWWRLGADLAGEEAREPTAATRRIAAAGPLFLSVGTLEMRKGYPVAVAAFERLWAEGIDATYVIVGRPGWNSAAFEDRLRSHSEMGRRLFWLEDADDQDLRFLYSVARAVLLPTFAEGFGLPLVEAARFGAPIIASDIPIFHEIGGDGVRYFDALSPESLAACICEALGTGRVAPKIGYLTWRESTVELMTLLRDGAYQEQIGFRTAGGEGEVRDAAASAHQDRCPSYRNRQPRAPRLRQIARFQDGVAHVQRQPI